MATELWALNFRDVLVAKGAIPSEVAGRSRCHPTRPAALAAATPPPLPPNCTPSPTTPPPTLGRSLGLGGECYGRVVRVGAAVTSVTAGDLVVCVPPDGLGSRLLTEERWVARAPAAAAPEEAVAGTMAYATAWLALLRQARITRGDTVLIHSAAGGVGLAAVHLCLRAGCTVYATASTPAKRELLLGLGVTHAFHSRDAATYVAGVRGVTAGAGVDVVLNSLAGEHISASLGLLRPFGRFVEIGKRDAYEGATVGLQPFLRGLAYSAAHLDVFMLEAPVAARALLDEVQAALPSLPRLPTVTYEMSEINAALDYMARGTHVGKILIRTPRKLRRPAPAPAPLLLGTPPLRRLAPAPPRSASPPPMMMTGSRIQCGPEPHS